MNTGFVNSLQTAEFYFTVQEKLCYHRASSVAGQYADKITQEYNVVTFSR